MSGIKIFAISLLLMTIGPKKCKEDTVKPVDNDLTTICSHEYEFVSVDDDKHQEACKLCGAVKVHSVKNHSFYKDAAKVADNKPATCMEDGWEWYICRCGATRKREMPIQQHNYSVVKFTTATCTDAGENTMQCKWCGLESPEKQPQEPFGHDFVLDETWTDGLPSSCTGRGTAKEKCTRCYAEQIVEVPELGHDYISTPIIQGRWLKGLRWSHFKRLQPLSRFP